MANKTINVAGVQKLIDLIKTNLVSKQDVIDITEIDVIASTDSQASSNTSVPTTQWVENKISNSINNAIEEEY